MQRWVERGTVAGKRVGRTWFVMREALEQLTSAPSTDAKAPAAKRRPGPSRA